MAGYKRLREWHGLLTNQRQTSQITTNTTSQRAAYSKMLLLYLITEYLSLVVVFLFFFLFLFENCCQRRVHTQSQIADIIHSRFYSSRILQFITWNFKIEIDISIGCCKYKRFIKSNEIEWHNNNNSNSNKKMHKMKRTK